MGARYFFLGKRPGLDWRMVTRLWRVIREVKADVLHAHNEGAGFYAGLAGLLAGRPVITTRHGASFGLDTLWVRRAAGLLSRRTVCVGKDVVRLARQVDHLPASRVRLIYNGVDTSQFAPDAKARARVRAELGFADTDRVLISVGRLALEKDYATLLQSLATAQGVAGQASLILVGDGPQREALSQEAERLGLAGRVRMLGDRQDVRDLLAAADVFVLSSISEGVSKALLEAMAVGLPVVATSVGGTPEVVEEGVTGLLVPPSRPDVLGQALDGRFCDDSSLAERLGRAGRERAQERFSVQATVAAYVELYREVAGPKGIRP